MTGPRRNLAAPLGASLAMALGSAQAAADQGAILVFSKTAAYRHKSIPAGIAAVEALGEQAGLRVDVSESASAFSDERLARYRAVVFLNTSGDVLDVSQRAAFERFVQRGGGFVGIHSASDTEYDWPWYGRLVGAYFHNHPAIQRAALLVDRDDASTAHLPVRWLRTDEWYNFRDTSWEPLQVLIRLDESSYTGGTMGAMHPITWRHGFDGGRAWYTAMGHTDESYAEPAFRQHLLEGIKWAAGISAP